MSVRSVLVLALGAALIATTSVVALAHFSRQRVQARLDVFLTARAERLQAAPRVRTAVYGDTLDEVAMGYYVAATRQCSEGDPAAALASIRTAVRCSQRGPWQRVDLPLLARVLAEAVAAAFAAGDLRLGVELYVDQCVVAIDEGNGTPEFPPLPDERLLQLDRATADFLADALQRLDERWPRFLSAESYLENAISLCSQFGMLDQSPAQAFAAWRDGFDYWTFQLALCDERVPRLPELSPPAVDWPARQKQIAAFAVGCADPPRGLAERVPGLVRAGEEQTRANLALLRLQRLALAFVQRAELPRLDDPLGSGSIAVDVRGDEATYRCEGMDGEKRIERTVRRR